MLPDVDLSDADRADVDQGAAGLEVVPASVAIVETDPPAVAAIAIECR